MSTKTACLVLHMSENVCSSLLKQHVWPIIRIHYSAFLLCRFFFLSLSLLPATYHITANIDKWTTENNVCLFFGYIEIDKIILNFNALRCFEKHFAWKKKNSVIALSIANAYFIIKFEIEAIFVKYKHFHFPIFPFFKLLGRLFKTRMKKNPHLFATNFCAIPYRNENKKQTKNKHVKCTHRIKFSIEPEAIRKTKTCLQKYGWYSWTILWMIVIDSMNVTINSNQFQV